MSSLTNFVLSYNRPAFVRETINSILAQSDKEFAGRWQLKKNKLISGWQRQYELTTPALADQYYLVTLLRVAQPAYLSL